MLGLVWCSGVILRVMRSEENVKDDYYRVSFVQESQASYDIRYSSAPRFLLLRVVVDASPTSSGIEYFRLADERGICYAASHHRPAGESLVRSLEIRPPIQSYPRNDSGVSLSLNLIHLIPVSKLGNLHASLSRAKAKNFLRSCPAHTAFDTTKDEPPHHP
ncbi:hypothetical protein F4823DRAFT_502829 [Ustulina deusta]|nr:hypothetical protein F4823DRAFT_502829 [Ustulina deusta]